jgi:oxygen-independent coproporphyrinogen-3 oxidase
MQPSDELGLYVHFPWCVRKCPYCDFNSHPLRGGLDQRGYLDALQRDITAQLRDLEQARVDTVFFGGGTPSLFAPDVFADLLGTVNDRLTAQPEITLEANPGTLEHQPLAGYLRAGVNRLSLGAQSFDPGQLTALGRIHGAGDIETSYRSARQAGFDNINLDLMYGLPGQSLTAAMSDLERAAELGPEHISWYQLTLEPKTEFWSRPPDLPGEGVIEEIEEAGRERLAAWGFERYEISAYARPGRQSRHNRNYWTFGDYLGAGAGAHGKLTRQGSIIRTEKPSQPRRYLLDPLACASHPLTPKLLAGEFLLNALRLVDGVTFEVFSARTGLEPETLAPKWERWVESGLLRADRIAATPQGLNFIDAIIADFLD